MRYHLTYLASVFLFILAIVNSTYSSNMVDIPNLSKIRNSLITIPNTPYAPGSLRITASNDTGESNSDGITYNSDPQFVWNQPSDDGGCGSGTDNYYQWAITDIGDTPWSDPRLDEGYTSNTYINTGIWANGDYTIWVQARDNCDNWGQWADFDFIIDTTSPTPPSSLTNPGGATTTSDTTPNVTWSGDIETGSGVWTYEVVFNGSGGNSDHSFNSGDSSFLGLGYQINDRYFGTMQTLPDQLLLT